MFVNIIKKRVSVYTLGCKVNQYESDSMMDLLKLEGCIIVPFGETADVYIINTCSVTNMAERKSRQILHRARKLNPDAVTVAVGCYVQAAREQLEQDMGIDIIVGNNRKKDICRILDEYFEEHRVEDNYIDINKTSEYEEMTLIKPSEHCRAYVKVQDGCNNFCSYCIIPYTRGRIRSRELGEVIREAEGLADKGIREIVVTGINLSSYCDSQGNDLLVLLQSLSKVVGIRRIRMGSLEPRIITDRFLEGICTNNKICPHFHLSLQSACNETLRRMNRKYTIEEYIEKCKMIRACYDRPAITTDVIVGFPGETDREFEITASNLELLNLYDMHIFKYSRRNGTVAADMPNQVPDGKKEERSRLLLDMADKHRTAYERSFADEIVEVLVEEYEEKDGRYYIKGHTDRYIHVVQEAEKEQCIKSVNSLIELKMQNS